MGWSGTADTCDWAEEQLTNSLTNRNADKYNIWYAANTKQNQVESPAVFITYFTRP